MNFKIKKILSKKNKSKLVCLTSYSKSIAKILDKYCDIILVGDSMANVLYGQNNTHEMSVYDMIKHTISVKMGVKKSLLVVDMPKGSYSTLNKALKNAKLILSKTKCDAIKLENFKKNSKIIKFLVYKGIPVMGHIGYTPQFKKKFGLEGETKEEIKRLLKEAKSIENAGAFSIVLECVTFKAARLITNELSIPTIGIGASASCDGQILVTDDMIGLSGFYPKFVKKYCNINKIIDKAVKKYANDVKLKKFPSKKNFLNGSKFK